MLEHLVRRLSSVRLLTEIVIATTTNDLDDQICNLANKLNVKFFRGSENDVMERVIKAAESISADVVVEVTGDCPIIDPRIVEQSIKIFSKNSADYVSNAHIRSYPDGMDVQIFKLNTLKKSSKMTDKKLDREHVTLHIRNNPNLFSHLHIEAPDECFWPELGLTLDELKDYELLKKIIEYFEPTDPFFSCLDVINLLRNKKSDWLEINKDILRKGDT